MIPTSDGVGTCNDAIIHHGGGDAFFNGRCGAETYSQEASHDI